MRRKSFRFLLALTTAAALAANGISPALAAGALTLDEVVNAAVNNNPAVIESQKRWEEKKAGVPIAGALPNPKVGIMKDDIPTGTLGPGQGMMTEYTLSQEFMFPGKLGLMSRMAANDAAMSEGGFQEKRLQTYMDAKAAYYDLLYAGKALEIGRENQQLMGQLAKVAQVNYATGMVPLQDTLRAQTEYSQMTTNLIAMAGMEAVARAKLNVIMGRPADTEVAVSEEFVAPPPNFELAGLQNTATGTKPSLQGMQAQVAMAENGVDLARKQSLPDFELRLGYKVPRDLEMSRKTWKVELMAMLPLWQGKNKAQVDAARANLEANKAALADMRNMTGLDVQMALTEAKTAWSQIDLYKNTIVPQAEQSYQAAMISYTNGKADFMAVLDAITTLRNAKLGYYKARTDYEKAAASIEKAVGKPLFGNLSQPEK